LIRGGDHDTACERFVYHYSHLENPGLRVQQRGGQKNDCANQNGKQDFFHRFLFFQSYEIPRLSYGKFSKIQFNDYHVSLSKI